MYRNHTIGVVVPAYNEAGLVGDVVRTVPEYVDRVYVVDDGSTDETWAEIREAARDVNERQGRPETNGNASFQRRIVPIQHERNRGVGGAIKTGYFRARDDRIDVTAVMGGDGQMPPDRLARLLDPIVEDRVDYAKGDRLYSAETAAEMPRHRVVGNRLLGLLTKLASGYWGIDDPQNGFTAISLSALDGIDLEHVYEFYGYCNDILVKLHLEGFRVADVPHAATYDEEESHIQLTTYVPRVSAMLLSNFLRRLRTEYGRDGAAPAGVGYLVGLGLGAGGLLRALAGAVTDGPRSSGARRGVLAAAVGAIVFVAGALRERAGADDRSLTIAPTDEAPAAPADDPAAAATDEELEAEAD
ncbi:MAG: glycosyltransferase family 2 protein [Haloarculaceae archaeon]